MSKEPMDQNQKFTLLVFTLVLLAVVVGVFLWMQGTITAMY